MHGSDGLSGVNPVIAAISMWPVVAPPSPRPHQVSTPSTVLKHSHQQVLGNGRHSRWGDVGGAFKSTANYYITTYSISDYRHVQCNCILSSKRPSPCKHPPPLLMILWFTYTRTCKRVIHTNDRLCQHPPPFLACQFQAPMSTYSREYGTHYR